MMPLLMSFWAWGGTSKCAERRCWRSERREEEGRVKEVARPA